MTRQKVTLQRNTKRRFLRRARFYRGVYARVARKLELQLSHVRQVALGMRRSERVEDALLREIQRIEKLTSKAA